MSISFQTSATGVKSTTGGTTFTIALSSTAGDQILIVVSSLRGSNLVASIADGGGNAYSFVGSFNAAGITTELWRSNSAHPAASGTITVTVAVTGFRCAGVAASYRGVDAIDLVGTATGTTSPLTSGSTTLRDSSSWLLTAGGLTAANAFTAQNGSLRNQITTTSLAAVLIDSNGAASPVTDSATMTASTWGIVNVFLRTGVGAPYFQQPLPSARLSRSYATSVKEVGAGVSVPTNTLASWNQPENVITSPRFGMEIAAAKARADSVVSGFQPPQPITLTVAGWQHSSSAFFRSRGYSRSAAEVSVTLPAATPVVSGWKSTDGQNAVTLNYAKPDFVSRLLSVAVALPPSASFLNFVAPQSQPQRFAPVDYSAPPKFGLVVAAIPTVAGWTPSTYAVSSIRRYARATSEVSGGALPAVVISNTIGWLHVLPNTNLPQSYQPGAYSAPDKFGLTVPSVVFLPAWQSPVERSSLPLTYSIIQDALLHASVGFPPFPPTLATWLKDNSQNAQIQNYAAVDYSAPAKFGLVAVTIPTISAWAANVPQNSVLLKYASTDYVNQVRPTLSTLLSSVPFLDFIAPNAQPQKFAPVDYSAPPKFGLVVTAIPTISSWASTDGRNAVTLNYAPSDYVAPSKFNLTTAFLSQWFGTDGWKSVILNYAPPEYVAPAKFGLATIIPISGWKPTDGQNAVVLEYASSDYVNQTKPTLATLLSSLPFLDFVAPKSLPQSFAPVDYSAPPKFGLVVSAPITVAGWSPTLGQNAVVLNYAKPDFVNQTRPTLSTLPPYSSFISFVAPNAQPQKFAGSTLDAPPKFGLVVVITTFLPGWQKQDDPPTVFLNYSRIEDSQLRAGVSFPPFFPTLAGWNLDFTPPFLKSGFSQGATFSAPDKFGIVQAAIPTLAGWSSTTGQKSLPTNYATPSWDAPPKFGLVATVIPTISSWSPTLGLNAVVLEYTPTDYVNQAKPTLFTLPPYSSFLDFIAPNAQPEKFAPVDYSAPAKFGLVVVATPTIASWSPTLGLNAVVLNYAKPDFVNQIRPTLSTLPPYMAFLDFIAPNAQPQKFAPVDYSAPPKFGLVFVAIPTLSSWTPTIGQKSVILNYAPSDYIAPSKFNLPTALISQWFGTDGQKSVILNYTPPDFVNQIRPTLSTLPLGTSFLAFIPPNAQPQKFAPADFVNQLRPTLTPLPTGFATDLTVWNRPANPPTFAQGDTYTAPVATLAFVAPSIIVRGVTFYKVIVAETIVDQQLTKTIIVNGKIIQIMLVS